MHWKSPKTSLQPIAKLWERDHDFTIVSFLFFSFLFFFLQYISLFLCHPPVCGDAKRARANSACLLSRVSVVALFAAFTMIPSCVVPTILKITWCIHYTQKINNKKYRVNCIKKQNKKSLLCALQLAFYAQCDWASSLLLHWSRNANT